MKYKFLAALALALALPLSAQMGPPAGGPGGGAGGPGGPAGPPPEAVLKDALSLTDTQVQQLHQLFETRGQASQALQQQIQAAEKALGDALNATNPDPTTVGTKLLALTALQKQHRTIAEAFKTGFDAMLTNDQKAKVQALEELGAQLQAVGALKAIGY